MKNNKAMTYVLLALVVGIWGYVIYRVVVQVGDDTPTSVSVRTRPTIDSDLGYYRWKDTLRYDTLYHVPFSNADITSNVVTEGDISIENDYHHMDQETYDPLAYAPAIDIQYLGYIENESKKQRIALVQINGQQYYMHPKQHIDGVTLVDVGSSDIKIKTDYQTLTISKQ